jgi:hypothetical protein
MAKSDWAKTGLADLHRQGFMKSAFAAPKKPKAPPKPTVGCDLCQDWHEQGKHRYVVWAVTGDVPLGNGETFVDLKSAKHAAEFRAASTGIDQAVSLGREPTHPKFKIVMRYEGGSGESQIPNASQSYRGFEIEPYIASELTTLRTSRFVGGKRQIEHGSRKVTGYLIRYPDSDATKFFPTLAKAKAYIDEY